MNKLITIDQVEGILNLLDKIGDDGSFLKIKSLQPYQRSFVHKSFLLHNDPILEFTPVESNERLEFLGDGCINFVVGEYLYRRFDEEQEGFLTKIRTGLVRSSMLYRFARLLGLGDYILLSPQVEHLTHIGPNKGRNNPRLYEDCFEAFIGAIIEDFGFAEGAKYAQRFLINIIEKTIDFSDLILCNENSKDTLQHYFQSLKWPNPTYEELDENGPRHQRVFTKGVFLKKHKLESLSTKVQKDVECFRLHCIKAYEGDIMKKVSEIEKSQGGNLIGICTGDKKTVAEQQCSREALINLSIDQNW